MEIDEIRKTDQGFGIVTPTSTWVFRVKDHRLNAWIIKALLNQLHRDAKSAEAPTSR